MKLIDLHCDTVLELCNAPHMSLASNSLAIDLDKLEKAQSTAQVFALFVDQQTTHSCFDTGMAMLARLNAELQALNHRIALATSTNDISLNTAQGKMSAFIAIEEGAVLAGKLENVRWFYEQGVRFITLTWNYPNEIGFPHGAEHGQKGLTPFGFDVLAEMNQCGMLIDVSHLSEGGFWDVARCSQQPFLATHSNCRALKEHTRNLSDAQIKALADKGGVMGMCVAKNFLVEGPDEGRLEAMVAHIKHAYAVGGIDVVALGSDFDGTSVNHEFAFVDDLHKLEPLLRAAGYSDEMLEKIFWRNAWRILHDVLA